MPEISGQRYSLDRRCVIGVTNTEILAELNRMRETIGTLSTDVAVHMSQCESVSVDTIRNSKALFGNGKVGLVQKVNELWGKKVEVGKFKIDLKSSLITLGLTIGVQIIVTKLGLL